MTDDFQLDPDAVGAEPLDEGGTWLLDLVSAVDHLRRGYRPGITVWDAFDEALEWAVAKPTLELTRPAAMGPAGHETIQHAIRTWACAMAERYNAGYQWPHPSPRRTFPPPHLDSA